MKFMNILIALLCAPLLSSMVAAQDQTFGKTFENWTGGSTNAGDNWVLVSISESGGEYYIQRKHVSNFADQNPKVWIKGEFQNDRTVNHRRSMQLRLFDCRNKKITLLSFINYMADGTIQDSWEGSETRYIIPESGAALWARVACPPPS